MVYFVDHVVTRAGRTLASNRAVVAVDGHLDVVHIGSHTRAPVVGSILAVDGHDAVGAAGDAAAETQLLAIGGEEVT